MSEKRHHHVVNVDEIEPTESAQGGFAYRRRRLSGAAGGLSLGCSHFELEPGKTAFPFHFHLGFEEGLFILEGHGTARIGGASVEVRPGDFLAFPPGPDASHALTNTGTTTLRYLALSAPATPISLEVVGYPDSKKVAYAAGFDAQKGLFSAKLMKIVSDEVPSLGYFDGEPLAKT